jgi:CheY-specific phosphatase CheX
MSQVEHDLCELLATKATELFSAYDVTCSKSEAPISDEQLCGILGFTGDQMCGSVVITATADAITCSNPIGDGVTRSWIAELTNQLVGRFKNELLRHAVDITMSVPVVLTATRLVPLPHRAIRPIQLAVGSGTMTIWLEIEGTPKLQACVEDQVASEGEAFLF